ncbi:MAG: ATPase, T2SS/T4P/T4SS family [Legionellales bacterium]|jgi:defect-in-organelle-trafficking protein DotB
MTERAAIATELKYPKETSRITEADLDDLLLFCVRNEASDITLQTGDQVVADIHGRLRRVTSHKLSHSEVAALLNLIYGANGTAQILSGKDLDTHYEIKPSRSERYRFRVNGTGCHVEGHEGIQITMRTIPIDPPFLKDMNLPPKLLEGLIPAQGIVVVAGSTGSGKSTLLAAIMREILETQTGKVLTYESPIEFVYDNVPQPNTLMAQHEIPGNLPNFPSAIRNALRRKPNYILLGEARDKETIAAVIDAALTGHVVYTTVHSNGVADTMRRMIAAFPADERHGRAVDLIELMRVVIWQRLLPTTDGRRVPQREWLVFDDEVRDAMLQTDFD